MLVTEGTEVLKAINGGAAGVRGRKLPVLLSFTDTRAVDTYGDGGVTITCESSEDVVCITDVFHRGRESKHF